MTVDKRLDLWQNARKHAKELCERHRRAEKEERAKLYAMATSKSKPKGQSKNTTDVAEDELEDISRLEDELKNLLPDDPSFEKGQWIAVAYHDDWYPGTLINSFIISFKI